MNTATQTLTLRDYAEKAYLDYSMYVILDRALPHIADGLKPVQRRIVYAMSELGLKAQQKFKKSARTVGDVLGKFHPHSDAACYEALVLMAQPFSYRYPLIEGQGNFGSSDDPKSFAAMRYTESRLSAYAEMLLKELDAGTVEFVPNFDGSLQEPELLPARLPNVLLNGTTGIAVGMATDIPPHNLQEITNALVQLLDHPKSTLDDLMEHVKGPDYPSHAEIITPQNEIRELYRTGHGSIRTRAIYSEENDEIVITALPYQVSGAKVLEQIAQQMQDKKLPQISDLRDESDHESPIRLVIVPRSNRIEIDELMQHLFATTDLEKSYRVNLNMIGLNGRPQVKGLLEILSEWLEFRKETVTRRLTHRFEQIKDRLHILSGLMIVYLNLDKVIRIIREEDDSKKVLMKQFALSDIQVNAILDTKLRHLAKLEEMTLRKEQEAHQKEHDDIEQTLAQPAKLKKLIRTELIQDSGQFGKKDLRKSPMVARKAAAAFTEKAILPQDPLTIILSQKGWIRAAKGHDIDVSKLSFKAGDAELVSCLGRSNQDVVFLDATGRSYSLPAHSLPSARGQGEPLTGKLSPSSGTHFVAMLTNDNLDARYVVASSLGYGFITHYRDLLAKNRSGKVLLTVPDGYEALSPVAITPESQYLAIATSNNHLLIMTLKDLPELNKGKGNKLISLGHKSEEDKETVMAMTVLTKQSTLTIVTQAKLIQLQPSDWAFYVSERGRRGNRLPKQCKVVTELRTA